MVRHVYVEEGGEPPDPAGVLYQYLTGRNGTFLQADRPGLEICLPVTRPVLPVRGLAEIQPHFRFARIPAGFLAGMLQESRRQAPYETLFYLIRAAGRWRCEMPAQVQTRMSVFPVDLEDPAYRGAVVEVHSHPPGARAYFSPYDNRSEQLFRIYVVLARVSEDRPEIAVRVGVYGQFFRLPPEWIFGKTAFEQGRRSRYLEPFLSRAQGI
ncbi:MAG TPA: Mov34/MPN/PAD-1 family protein [Anaerolineales bacterium]|nr:Mov34/MPN/PAD-1 family protein [Anaerolineales bacterium]